MSVVSRSRRADKERVVKVLFVCTGNLCRSPMAEALLRHELTRRGCSNVEVSSAGTWAYDGSEATMHAIKVLAGRHVDLSAHRSRPLVAEEIEAADVIIAMTSVHVREILERVPRARHKVILLKEIPEIAAVPAADTAARIEALLTATRPHPRRGLDVDDPMGLPRRAYERCAGDLEAGITALAEVLCPSRQ
jgi:protein-tyrosine-phosphatase